MAEARSFYFFDFDPFVKQIEDALDHEPESSWQGEAWSLFVYACNHGRPFSLITARGHADDTIKAGFEVFRRRGTSSGPPAIGRSKT